MSLRIYIRIDEKIVIVGEHSWIKMFLCFDIFLLIMSMKDLHVVFHVKHLM